MSDAIFDRVKKIITEQIDVKEDQITMSASFTDDLGADSLEVVEIVMQIEEEFGFDIPDEDVEHIQTVGHAVDYITKKTNTAEV